MEKEHKYCCGKIVWFLQYYWHYLNGVKTVSIAKHVRVIYSRFGLVFTIIDTADCHGVGLFVNNHTIILFSTRNEKNKSMFYFMLGNTVNWSLYLKYFSIDNWQDFKF